MCTQHPTVADRHRPTGTRARAPKRNSTRRISRVVGRISPTASQAVVFGSAAHHAELAYLTNFVPKLEPGIALLTRDGNHKLLFGGGPNMIGAMQPAHLHRRHGAAQCAGEARRRMDVAAADRRRRACRARCARPSTRPPTARAQRRDRARADLMRQKSPSRARRHPRRLRQPEQGHDGDARRGAHRAAAPRPRCWPANAPPSIRRAGYPHAVQPRRRAHAAAVRDARRPPRRSAAGLCRGAQVQLLGGRLCLLLERAAAGRLAGGAAARQRALGDPARRAGRALSKIARGRRRPIALIR